MIFTMGNLLTLGVVFVLLILFRQLDRNNRSLDKLRRYGERLREELGTFVANREDAVKDYAVELDVQQKAAKELLKRIVAVEEGLAIRVEGIVKIDERIGAYDKALEELLRMTSRAQENLERLRNESSFTDGVDKRIKEARAVLDRLEKHLGDVELRFERENAVALERTQEAFTAAVKSTVADLQATAETVERRVEDHRDAIMAVEKTRAVNLARDVQEIKSASARALEEARQDADKLETAAFTKLKDQALERSARFQTAVEEKLAQFMEISKQRLSEAQILTKSFKEEWKRDTVELEEKKRETREEWKKDVLDMAALARGNKEDWKRDVGEFSTLVRTVKEEWKRDSAEVRVSLEAIKATIRKEGAAMSAESVAAMRTALGDLEADQAKRLSQLKMELAMAEKALREGQTAKTAELQAAYAASLAALREAEKTQTATIHGALEELEADQARRLSRFNQELAEAGKTLRDDQAAKIAELHAAHQAALASLREAEKAQSADIAGRLVVVREEAARIDQAAAARNANLETGYTRMEGDFKRRSAALEEAVGRMEAQVLASAGEDAARRQSELREVMENSVNGIADRLEAEKRRLDELAAAASTAAGDLNAKLDEMKKGAELRLGGIVEETERKVLADTEQRLEAYRAAQTARFDRLALLADDIGRFDTELRGVMAATENRIRGDFVLFEKEAATSRQNVAAAFMEDAKTLRTDLAGVERELAALKTRAYDNVSEKLKLFEDDFFKDLAKRGEEIDNRLDEWRSGQEALLQELAAESEQKRQVLETDYTERLRQRLADLADKSAAELDRLNNQTGAFEDGIREQLTAADQALKAFQEQLARDLDDARNAAAGATKAEIARHSLVMAEMLKKDQRELEGSLHDLGAAVEERRLEILGRLDTSYKEVETWQTRVGQQVKDADSAVDENRRRIREMAAESDERLAALRAQVKEAHDEADDFRADLFGRTEEQIRTVDAAVKDADRRIKEFVAQTKLFDRADELKAELERRIEDFRSDLNGLDQRRQEAAELEAQFIKIKRLEDEVNAKMTRFMSEKRRVELMEADFKRLIQTAQSVDEKLAQVTASDDTLQNLQAQLRRLEDAVGEAETKYLRIEKKTQILDATAEGIDRNFQALREAETTAKRFDEDLRRLGETLAAVRGSVEKVAADKDKADAVAEKMAGVDSILADLEERTEALQKAREWLARTETRLTELSKQAQDQVKIMGNLLKAEGQKGLPHDKGAPPIGVRETVVKLAHQGWSVDEIARAVKLSKGEVELILEIAPKI